MTVNDLVCAIVARHWKLLNRQEFPHDLDTLLKLRYLNLWTARGTK